MSSMYVMGIDFGNDTSYIAVPRGGGIETIANDYSLRATPSCVALSSRNRIIGVAAKNQLITNMRNTVTGFKRLLGKKFDDPSVEYEKKFIAYQLERTADNGVGVKVNYLDEERVFTIQQVTAMYFTKLKETAQSALQSEVTQCVISVPCFFDNSERQALLDAANIAGLKVLRIFNDTASTALTYGIYKQDLPAPEEPPRHVIFVDCGHSSLQVAACAINKGKLKLLAVSADPFLGGRDIDMALADHFSAQFETQYKVKAKTNMRAFTRLLGEVEKLKKQMSANSTKLPLSIECFMDDKDVRGEMKRSDMESLCAGFFERVEKTLRDCLESSKLTLDAIHSVEIVGGSSRVPAIKTLIENVFDKVPSTTLNQDEAVARGCALQCAILCPAILVRDFSITDVQYHPVRLIWDHSLPNDDGYVDIFPKNSPIPFSKIITFNQKEDFGLEAVYVDTKKTIGHFSISGVKPDATGSAQKVRVKARININGLFLISNAVMSDNQATKESDVEPMDTNGIPPSPGKPESETMESGELAEEVAKDNKTKESGDKKDSKAAVKSKNAVKTIDLEVSSVIVGTLEQAKLNDFTEHEGLMISSDKQEKDRVDARNGLEEYIYDLRGKLSDEELGTFMPNEYRQQLSEQLDAMENWLYEEGEGCTKAVYADRLIELKDKGEPLKKRKLEYEIQPSLFDEYGSSLQLTQKAIDQYRAGAEQYNHLEEKDVVKVQESVQVAQKWLDEHRSKFAAARKFENPPLTAVQIRDEKKHFEAGVKEVFEKPKPKPAPQPAQQQATPPQNKAEGDAKAEGGGENHQQSEGPLIEEIDDIAPTF